MNPFLKNLSSFLKRYTLIVLAFIVAGNLIVWKNLKKQEHYFQYTIKARAVVDYYDLVRSQFEKIAKTFSDASKQSDNLPVKSATIESYRNENYYYVEMKLQFTDTNNIAGIINKVNNLLKSDRELKLKYFDRLDNLNKLISEGIELSSSISSASGNAEAISTIEKIQAFEMKIYQINLIRDRDNFEQNLDIYFPPVDEAVFVRASNSSTTFVTGTILFFIIGLFAAVVIDRFRN